MGRAKAALGIHHQLQAQAAATAVTTILNGAQQSLPSPLVNRFLLSNECDVIAVNELILFRMISEASFEVNRTMYYKEHERNMKSLVGSFDPASWIPARYAIFLLLTVFRADVE